MPVISKKKRMRIRRYMSIAALIDTLRRQKLAILNPESWDDRNDRLFMRVYKSHTKAGGLYGMCAALRGETYHHWKIFAGGASGACLVLKRRPLEAYLDSHQPEPGTEISYDEVNYLRLDEVKKLSPDHIKDLPFLKRYGFKDEDEYRIVIETVADQQPAIFINCPHAWIDTIYLNPWLYENQAQSLIETIREIPGCEKLNVKPSQLTDSTTWREAADRIAGRAHRPALTLAEAGKPKLSPKRKQVAVKLSDRL
ncbi:DUF2971 domain-containing protein [Rhizobium ruizarguesonis]|uniref:DUF2971 domain-containing protein n=1 Tax=Rhizobium TaxID=379 RepID=UPI0010316E4F|nr:DUF2971 domain-containing protein [Rhizobium ruizarguesonis]TBA68914.1 DUF2971 domain-containing protein [Rhizobium ruizarguesonis]